MARFGGWKALGWGVAGLLGVLAPAACGGTGEHAREGAAGTPATSGGAGMPAAGHGGAAGASGTAAAGAAGGGTTGVAGTPSCSLAESDALIATFDEGAVIADRNYPLSGAMPGGTYAYGDPDDTGMTFSVSVVPDGHTCKALAMSITGTSFRGMGLWTIASVDATAFTGVTFWARRGAGSSDPTGLVVNLGLDAVTSTDGGGTGTCVLADGDCVRPQTTIALGDAWTEYVLYWPDFTPGVAGGDPVPASGMQVNGLDFSFELAGTGVRTTVVELDDIAFLTSP